MNKIDNDKLTELFKQGKSYREIGKELGVSAAAVCKRVHRLGLIELPESVNSLTDKERKFCLAVASGQSRTNAVMQAYDVTSRESAKALQNTLMKNPEIQTAIADLMELHGLSRSYRIKRLKQHVDNRDPHVSLKALDQSWKLDGYKPEVDVQPQVEIVITKDYSYLQDPIPVTVTDVNQFENTSASKEEAE